MIVDIVSAGGMKSMLEEVSGSEVEIDAYTTDCSGQVLVEGFLLKDGETHFFEICCGKHKDERLVFGELEVSISPRTDL